MKDGTSGSARKPVTRDAKRLRSLLLGIPQIRAVRVEILKRREVAGSGDVTQEDVDLVARALVGVRERPYPQAIVAVAGGSLSTVGPMFHDWWMRFAYRDADPNSPELDAPTRIALHVQRLVAQLEAAVREQIRGVPDPLQALIAAAQFGEQQGLKAQLKALAADRDRLSDALAAMTYKVSEVEGRLTARASAEVTAHTEFERVTDRLHATLEQLRGELARPALIVPEALTKLATQVRQLRADIGRTRRGKSDASRVRKTKGGNRKPSVGKSGAPRRRPLRSKNTNRARRRAPGVLRRR